MNILIIFKASLKTGKSANILHVFNNMDCSNRNISTQIENVFDIIIIFIECEYTFTIQISVACKSNRV
jgi:hypothetical protein